MGELHIISSLLPCRDYPWKLELPENFGPTLMVAGLLVGKTGPNLVQTIHYSRFCLALRYLLRPNTVTPQLAYGTGRETF